MYNFIEKPFILAACNINEAGKAGDSNAANSAFTNEQN